MHRIHHDTLDTEQRADALKSAYGAGYCDAVVLLRQRSTDCITSEPIERVQDRYLNYLAKARLSDEALAYLSGFGDAASDNLPCPSNAIRPVAHRIAA
jgi:hypothetical protein